jgi:hypothetical protein
LNHKRGRKKDSRAGCLMCKPHKANAYVGQERQMRKRDAQREVAEARQARAEEEEERLWETSLANPANN